VGHAERIAVTVSGVEDGSEEFGIREGFGPTVGESFARKVVGGLLVSAHRTRAFDLRSCSPLPELESDGHGFDDRVSRASVRFSDAALIQLIAESCSNEIQSGMKK
jgi:hypothetical protein